MVLDDFVGGFGWFWMVLGGFGWFRVLVTTPLILKSIASLLNRIPLKHSKKSKIFFAICLNLLIYYGH